MKNTWVKIKEKNNSDKSFFTESFSKKIEGENVTNYLYIYVDSHLQFSECNRMPVLYSLFVYCMFQLHSGQEFACLTKVDDLRK